MAKKVVLLDDMEDGEVVADGTYDFAIEGRAYEIDLSTKNAVKMRADFQRWVDRARPVGRHAQKKPVKHGASGYNAVQLTAIRAWARKNGWPNLSDRGKVPAEIIAAYDAAGGVTPEFSSL